MRRAIFGFVAAVLLSAAALSAQGSSDVSWKLTHDPGAAAQATKTQAAASAGFWNVVDCIYATFSSGSSAPGAASNVQVLVRDGASGVGAVLASWRVSLPTTAGLLVEINACPQGGLQLPGTNATSMTIEFSAAGATNTFETFYARGHVEKN